MSSLRLAVAAALAVLVSASPGAESQECAELGGCAVAPEGGAADHLLFQARAKMHKADTSAAEEGGEIHKSHKSAVEDSGRLEPVCQIKEKRLTAAARRPPQGRHIEKGRGGFLSDGYGIVGNVATAGGCTQVNCNIDQPHVPFAADLFTPVHTEGEQSGLCVCMRKGTEKTLIKWETNSFGGHHKDGCHAQQCWYEYATAVYATEVKDWVTQWDRAVVNGYVATTAVLVRIRDGGRDKRMRKQTGWDVGCVTITDQTDPIEEENLMTVDGMLDKVGEYNPRDRERMLCEGLGITRGRQGEGLRCLTRDRVGQDMKSLIPGLKIKIQEKQPEMAPSEPEAGPGEEPEELDGAPEELCVLMGKVVSKLLAVQELCANEMNHVSDVQQNKNTGHAQVLDNAMKVLEEKVTDDIHDRIQVLEGKVTDDINDRMFDDVLKELTILRENEHKYTDLDSYMVKFTASRTKAKHDMSKLRGYVGALPKENLNELHESLDQVMLDLNTVKHHVLEGALVMDDAQRALTCP